MSPFKEPGVAIDDFLRGKIKTFGAEAIFAESLRIGEPELYKQFTRFRRDEDYNIPITAFLKDFSQKQARIIFNRLNDSSFTRAYFHAKELDTLFKSSRSDKQKLFLTVNAHAAINHNSRTTSRRSLSDIFERQKRVTIKGEPQRVSDLERYDFGEIHGKFHFQSTIPLTTACYSINKRQAMRGILMKGYKSRLKKVCGKDDAEKILQLLDFFVNRRLFSLKKANIINVLSAESRPRSTTPMVYHVPTSMLPRAYRFFEMPVKPVESLRKKINCPDPICSGGDARLKYNFGALNMSESGKSIDLYVTGVYLCNDCGGIFNSWDPNTLEGILVT
jgi:hypothetical protein